MAPDTNLLALHVALQAELVLHQWQLPYLWSLGCPFMQAALNSRHISHVSKPIFIKSVMRQAAVAFLRQLVELYEARLCHAGVTTALIGVTHENFGACMAMVILSGIFLEVRGSMLCQRRCCHLCTMIACTVHICHQG